MATTRPYCAPARDDARRQTRRRIRTEAEALFLRNGYVPTTLAAVAEAAGVSGRYVQMVFGSKASLLSEVIEVAVAGDDTERALAGRDAWAAMLEAGGEDMLRGFATIVAGVYLRGAALLAVAAVAGETDPALVALQTRSRQRRLQDCETVSDRLHHDGWLDPTLTAAAAADTVYALSSPELYLVLRAQRQLPHAQYADWLGHTLVGALGRAG